MSPLRAPLPQAGSVGPSALRLSAGRSPERSPRGRYCHCADLATATWNGGPYRFTSRMLRGPRPAYCFGVGGELMSRFGSSGTERSANSFARFAAPRSARHGSTPGSGCKRLSDRECWNGDKAALCVGTSGLDRLGVSRTTIRGRTRRRPRRVLRTPAAQDRRGRPPMCEARRGQREGCRAARARGCPRRA